MILRLANEHDAENLSRFYASFILPGAIELQIDRPVFFDFYKMQSPSYCTFVLENADNEIQACCSFVIKESPFGKSTLRYAIATDLRVAANRAALIEWGSHFKPVIQKLKSDFAVETIFSPINYQDPFVMNTFLRPRRPKRKLPKYQLYRKYSHVSLHGLWPWAQGAVPSLNIKTCEPQDLEHLVDYLLSRAPYRALSLPQTRNELVAHFESLPGFGWSQFVVARNGDSAKVIGCLCLQNSEKVQTTYPFSYASEVENFRQGLKALSWFRKAKPIAPPSDRRPQKNPLRFTWAYHIHVENEDVFHSLLLKAWELIPENHFLTYSHCDQDFKINPPKGWIHLRQPFGLFLLPGESSERSQQLLDSSQDLNPEVYPFYL